MRIEVTAGLDAGFAEYFSVHIFIGNYQQSAAIIGNFEDFWGWGRLTETTKGTKGTEKQAGLADNAEGAIAGGSIPPSLRPLPAKSDQKGLIWCDLV